jgi:hypothetical protein
MFELYFIANIKTDEEGTSKKEKEGVDFILHSLVIGEFK